MADHPLMLRRAHLLLIAGAILASPLLAQESGAPDSGASVVERVDPRSPRAAMTQYLVATRRGDFAAVAGYFPGTAAERSVELARRLKAVLDRHLWVDLDLIAPSAAGDTTDGLPRDLERIGAVPGPDGDTEYVQMRRNAAGAIPAWVFAPATAERIDVWYDALDDHWMRERMPLALQQPGPFGVELWQLGLLALLVPVALVIAYIAARLSASLLRRLSARTSSTLDDRLVERTRGPVRALWTVLLFRALVEFAGLPIGVEQGVGFAARIVGALVVTWLMLRVTYVLEDELPNASWAVGRPEIRSVLPLVGRVVRVFLLAVGAIALVAQFGYSVATLIAGLGIGGIAVALAAQKTLEHVFGSMAIGLDQPIRVGDWVRTGDVEGAVEAIGLRSTRIRTIEHSVVAIPNGRLSEQQMENLGVRERILLRTTVGLEYGTTVTQLRAVRDDIERLLRAEPLIWPDRVVVRFATFGSHSLNIDIISWVVTTDVDVFRSTREALYFRIMEIVESHGCAFAFPTQTIHLAPPPTA
jgi:MscS family membrane protein